MSSVVLCSWYSSQSSLTAFAENQKTFGTQPFSNSACKIVIPFFLIVIKSLSLSTKWWNLWCYMNINGFPNTELTLFNPWHMIQSTTEEDDYFLLSEDDHLGNTCRGLIKFTLVFETLLMFLSPSSKHLVEPGS